MNKEQNEINDSEDKNVLSYDNAIELLGLGPALSSIERLPKRRIDNNGNSRQTQEIELAS